MWLEDGRSHEICISRIFISIESKAKVRSPMISMEVSDPNGCPNHSVVGLEGELAQGMTIHHTDAPRQTYEVNLVTVGSIGASPRPQPVRPFLECGIDRS